jgi:hypothetical protein
LALLRLSFLLLISQVFGAMPPSQHDAVWGGHLGKVFLQVLKMWAFYPRSVQPYCPMAACQHGGFVVAPRTRSAQSSCFMGMVDRVGTRFGVSVNMQTTRR